jgi:hypothetical protein
LLGLIAILLAAISLWDRPPASFAGEPPPPAGICLEDVNGNRIVNSTDLLAVAIHYGNAGDPGYDPAFDINGNGSINSLDLLLVALAFGPCDYAVYVSDLQTVGTPVNGFGPFERDTSNGESVAGDGLPITINGLVYAKGLGVHAPSDLSFSVPAGCTQFKATVGIDDEVTDGAASVTFEVWNSTATRLYQSPVKTAADPGTAVTVDLTGITTLRLRALPGASDAFDHGDWADAMLICEGGDFTPPAIWNVVAMPAGDSATITWATDEIANSRVEYGPATSYGNSTPLDSLLVTTHSGRITGLTPGTEYHFRVRSRDAAGNVAFSNDATFTTTASLFGPPAPFPAGSRAHGVAIGDLNGDGFNDLVTANAAADTISVLMGNGNGTFAVPVAYATGHQPKAVALGHLNGDAFLDAVTANQGTNNVSVLLGGPGGAFGAKTDYAACTGAHEVTLALLNADAHLDIACAGWGATQMRVLLGTGVGTFAAAVTYTAGSAPHSIVAGDFNSDNIVDLATANHDSANISVFIGTGTGAFSAHVTYAAGGSGPHSIRAADLNGDGDLDNQSDNIGILYGNPGIGVGTFQTVTNITVGNTPKGVAIADINMDGHLDILTANINDNYPTLVNPGGDTISFILGNGLGMFQPPVPYAVGQGPFAIAVGNLNGDTKPDIATANWWDNGVTVRLNTLP